MQPRFTPRFDTLSANPRKNDTGPASVGPRFCLVPAPPRVPIEELECKNGVAPPYKPSQDFAVSIAVSAPCTGLEEASVVSSGEVLDDDGRSNSMQDEINRRRSTRRHSTMQKIRRAPTNSSDVLGEKTKKEKSEPSHRDVFYDVSAMKERVRKNIAKPEYNVTNFYSQYGIWQFLARSHEFEKVTMTCIVCNAIWIAVDTDLNDEELLLESSPVFQLAENMFCMYFLLEWMIRFLSFQHKRDCVKDSWFVFDGLMVVMMVFETWCFAVFLLMFSAHRGSLGLSNVSVLRIARLLRLGRIFRMARILRMMPELVVLMKGLAAAFRSVFFTLLMLVALCFLFAIAFTQLTAKTGLGQNYFNSVLESMMFLLIHGTLLLSADYKIAEINLAENGILLNFLFLFFILSTAILLMNMLIGVLCEMVSVVAATEKEEMLVSFVNMKLTKVMALIDSDGGGTISKDEFIQILDSVEAMQALQDVGVDVVGLVDFADFIFGGEDENEEGGEVELTMQQFMEIVLSLRGSNSATVKDMVDLRKFHNTADMKVRSQLGNINQQIRTLSDSVVEHQALLVTVASAVLRSPRDILHMTGAESPNGKKRSKKSSAIPQKAVDTRSFASTRSQQWEPLNGQCKPALHVPTTAARNESNGFEDCCSERNRGSWCVIETAEVEDILQRLSMALISRSPALDEYSSWVRATSDSDHARQPMAERTVDTSFAVGRVLDGNVKLERLDCVVADEDNNKEFFSLPNL
eukprot:TRINITY_DN40904_c0_g1_i1.p1 TRINITY_DN40904_c0_g1~~TRINITY_DN40904_c0_g1_i1.p1  ORF type:complete len:797 (-),score=159.98 TRINITY_DN40904_c0_g1_i1:221-2464(-)